MWENSGSEYPVIPAGTLSGPVFLVWFQVGNQIPERLIRLFPFYLYRSDEHISSHDSVYPDYTEKGMIIKTPPVQNKHDNLLFI